MNDELYHYGVPGMKWGQRRAALKTQYKKDVKKANGDYDKIADAKAKYAKEKHKLKEEKKKYDATPEGQLALMKRKQRAGAIAAGTALAVIGTLLAPAMSFGGLVIKENIKEALGK